MQRTNPNFDRPFGSHFPLLAILTAALLLAGFFPLRSAAQEKGQKSFPSAEAASAALLMAVDSNDEKAMLAVLGPDAKPVIFTGSVDEDSERHANFCRRYMELHRLVNEPDGTTTLYIGAENWPVPFPLVQKGGAWYFDTEAGVKEIQYRRIGHNEMAAIHVCHELVAAEKEYYSRRNNVYAAKIASDAGQKSGLYWPVSGTESESPIGPRIAAASVDEGAGSGSSASSRPVPFQGYFFGVLTRQGKNAPGGATDYVANGKMTAGFAFLAYPAEYRVTGVMTLIVNQDGVVYEKDLGEKTADLAKAIKEYDPDSTWHNVEEQSAQQTSSDQKRK